MSHVPTIFTYHPRHATLRILIALGFSAACALPAIAAANSETPTQPTTAPATASAGRSPGEVLSVIIASLKSGKRAAFSSCYALTDPAAIKSLQQQFDLIQAERKLQTVAEYHFGTDGLAQLPGPDDAMLKAVADVYAAAKLTIADDHATLTPTRDSGRAPLHFVRTADGWHLTDPTLLAPIDATPDRIPATIAAVDTVIAEINAQKLWTSRDALVRLNTLLAIAPSETRP